MRRTALLYALPAAIVVATWLRLEEPRANAHDAIWIAVLALLPALAPPVWPRALAAAAVSLLALERAFDVSVGDLWPGDDRGFARPLAERLRDGLLEFYEVNLPFSPDAQPEMAGVVVAATYCFCLAISLTIAGRRPLAASAALAAGAAWPATLVSGGSLAHGALVLATVLLLLAAARRRPPTRAAATAVAAGAIVVAAAFAATSPAVAKSEFLAWERWDPYDAPDRPVGVRYVWTANYGGIEFPSKRTLVLSIQGPRRPVYWRATTLDVFDGIRWLEQQPPFDFSTGRARLLGDPLLPAAARDERTWLETRVRVHALRDAHLPAPATPVVYDPNGIGLVRYGPSNVAQVEGGLERGDVYTVWSHTPQPRPAQLATVEPTRPESGIVGSYLDLAPGLQAPLQGTAQRQAELGRLLESSAFGEGLRGYGPLFRAAERLAGDAATPYAAAATLEAWFRGGAFTYDEQPPLPSGVPPLVSFVTDHRRGHCQHFAGAMALMLRSLGVPARVAAGFTSGSWDADDRAWKVTDHDAHAWVEVWFDGWGWLAFDPTPGRGLLSAAYTSASPLFDVEAFEQSLGGNELPFGRAQLERAVRGPEGGDVVAVDDGSPAAGSLLALLAAIAFALASAVVVAKVALRKGRHLRRSPHAIVRACRAELAEFLADQRVDVPAGATLDELGMLLRDRVRVDATPFTRAAGAARYGRPNRARREAVRARRELRVLLRAARARLTPAERLRGLLSLRSLGLG